jgi:hypothetical protein
MTPRQSSLPLLDAGAGGALLGPEPSPDPPPGFDPSPFPESLFESPPDAGVLPERDPDDPLPDVPRRSSLAQPEPLKTIEGLDTAFRMEPSAPHAGQNRGPSALMPWMTSVTRPQTVQA